MIDTLSLMTGIDVPIPELQLVIHQPTCKEIALAGREAYLSGAQCLCIDGADFFQGNSLPKDITNFQIFMTIISEEQTKEIKNDVNVALSLFFPSYSPKFLPRSFGLFSTENKEMKIVDENNFNILQAYIKDILCLNKDKKDFNPHDEKAKEIAEKLKKGRQRIAAEKASKNSGDMFTQYLSIITIAIPSMSLKDAMDLTMFQLYDLVERYSMYSAWDIDMRARMAGADIKKEPDNWMKDIH